MGGGEIYSPSLISKLLLQAPSNTASIMTETSTSSLLTQLSQLKNQIGDPEARQVVALIRQLGKRVIDDVSELLQLHELLLFLRAYPQSPRIVTETESQLRKFSGRVKRLEKDGADLSEIEHPEASGISGTAVIDTFTYDIVLWLSKRHASEITLSWDWFESENRLAEAWTRFMPLLGEDSFVEADVPYTAWLEAAAGNDGLHWLLEKFGTLPVSHEAKSELYNAQQLYTQWTPAYDSSRTGLRSPRQELFFHREPLIRRSDISFENEVVRKAPAFERLSRRDGERVLDNAREASTVRYRELYGFTHGDAAGVLKYDLGRGVDLFLIGLPPDKRLPLRSYHAAMAYKNEVPIGYFEGLSLFERMESGFNLYYTFRDGETVWLYARILNVLHELTGVSVFTLDPYQVGHENEEGIQSGAFWFYRKLGFRSTDPALQALTAKEEAKMRTRKGHRTSALTLRKLAVAPMVLEINSNHSGSWDQFRTRTLTMSVQQEMRNRFNGDAEEFYSAAVNWLRKVLKKTAKNSLKQTRPFADFAVTLYLLRDNIKRWSRPELKLLGEVIEAKGNADEATYLRLMQMHSRLRLAFLKLGATDQG